MAKKSQTSNKKAGTIIAVGAGIAALSAIGYFFFGPKGEKNRKKLKGWMIKMKGEIVEKMEGLQEVTEPVYNNIVDGVAAAYIKAGTAREEVMSLADDLKKHWKAIARSATPAKKKAVKKTIKKSVKKAVKKVTKK